MYEVCCVASNQRNDIAGALRRRSNSFHAPYLHTQARVERVRIAYYASNHTVGDICKVTAEKSMVSVQHGMVIPIHALTPAAWLGPPYTARLWLKQQILA